MKLFEIQTLSAHQVPKRYDPNKYYLPHGYEIRKRRRGLADYGRLGFDPISIIASIGTILPGLFPNLWAERSTMDHFNKLFPSNGYWTSSYKNWLLSRIKWAKDIQRDILMYTKDFVRDNRNSICPSCTNEQALTEFYKILSKEMATGGQSPVGNIYGAGFNLETLAIVGGGVLLLVLLTKKKSRKR